MTPSVMLLNADVRSSFSSAPLSTNQENQLAISSIGDLNQSGARSHIARIRLTTSFQCSKNPSKLPVNRSINPISAWKTTETPSTNPLMIFPSQGYFSDKYPIMDLLPAK